MTDTAGSAKPKLTARASHSRETASWTDWLRTNSVYIAFALLVIFNLAVTPGFNNLYALRLLLFQAAPLILIALGQSLAIGTRGIDLSVGSLMALSSSMIAVAIGLGQPGAIAVAILTTAFVGLFNGAMVTFLRVDPLISGLALLVAGRGLAKVLLDGSRVGLPSGGPLGWLGMASYVFIPATAIIAIVIAVIVAALVRRTTFGRYTLFAGASRSAAFLAGTPVRRTLLGVYAISGLLAGLAGVFASARTGAADPNYIGVLFELDAIAAAVIGGNPLSGGRISIMGAVFGALLLEVLNATFIMNNIDYTYAQILKAAFIVAALYLQRAGH
ncbi:ABC transporter permease [Salinisphaera sp.]|uniref:ABC transporter permease n=1 Tax=Salinisphaera sp. TaxID=1914330 RepID=UPI002D773953|nr:ABC transporter permease [Salinisphaera sp.]HET7314609.1 ABC transporter permease [Salinisphaera sp.]